MRIFPGRPLCATIVCLWSRAAACALVALGTLILIPSCGEDCDDPLPLPPGGLVVVSIPPLVGLVQPLLPPASEVRVLVPAGRSAHGYQPSAEDIKAIAQADAIIFVGLNLESGLVRAVRGKPVIRASELLGLESGGSSGGASGGHDHASHDDHEDHSGHDHAHDHGGSGDPHIWLDPVLMAEFVRALPAALPESLRREDSESNAAWLAGKIDEVDSEYRERLAPFAGRSIVTHHASFNRPAERYGLQVAAVLRAIETLEPSPADMAAAVRAIKERGVGAIFVEPQFGMTSAERVAETAGVELVTLDPLGDGNWFALMRSNLDGLVEGLGKARPAEAGASARPAPAAPAGVVP